MREACCKSPSILPLEDIEYRSVPSSPPSPSLAVPVSRYLLCLRGREHVKEVFIELPEGLDIAANGQ